MDHSDVVRLEAVEKYVLGELPPELRDKFEEHYFDCAECAADVKHLTAFMTASRMVLEEKPLAKEASVAKRAEKPGWYSWLRPFLAVPAMAVLAAIVVFQNIVTIPALQHQGGADGTAQVYGSSHHLQGASRGEGGTQITIGATESFALDFDFTPAVPYQSYTAHLIDSSGKTVLSFGMTGELANKEVHVVIPGGNVQPGKYDLVFNGVTGASNTNGAQPPEVQRIPFIVEVRP
jgi:hypothetical protein